MVAPGGQGPWQPRGSGLLVAVVALSVVALVVHGAIALVLLHGTVRPPVTADRPVGRPTPTVTAPKPTATPTPTPAPAPRTAAPAAPTGISQAACASGSAVEAGLTKDAIRVHRAVCALFSGVSGWGGRTGSGGEHSTGQALDIMIPNSSVGQAIANYVRANAKALGVSEVIWSQKIWTVQRSGEGWRAMSNRGSPTANHYDHVHVTVYGSSGTV